MPTKVFSWKDDPMGTIVAAPELRGRYVTMNPGPMNELHSHEESQGYSFMLCIEGKFRIEVESETADIGPGQVIWVTPKERHRMKALGTGPCVMYLACAPHGYPTHTFYDGEGKIIKQEGVEPEPTWQGKPALGPVAAKRAAS
jgi:quercetin dioxygenase-like cupin family protein